MSHSTHNRSFASLFRQSTDNQTHYNKEEIHKNPSQNLNLQHTEQVQKHMQNTQNKPKVMDNSSLVRSTHINVLTTAPKIWWLCISDSNIQLWSNHCTYNTYTIISSNGGGCLSQWRLQSSVLFTRLLELLTLNSVRVAVCPSCVVTTTTAASSCNTHHSTVNNLCLV